MKTHLKLVRVRGSLPEPDRMASVYTDPSLFWISKLRRVQSQQLANIQSSVLSIIYYIYHLIFSWGTVNLDSIPNRRKKDNRTKKKNSSAWLRVGHDWVTSLSLFTFTHWRRKWQLTPVFLSGESQGWGSLVGCHLWGCTELDITEVT